MSPVNADESMRAYGNRGIMTENAEPPKVAAFLHGSQVGGVTTVFDQKPPMCNRGFKAKPTSVKLSLAV